MSIAVKQGTVRQDESCAKKMKYRALLSVHITLHAL